VRAAWPIEALASSTSSVRPVPPVQTTRHEDVHAHDAGIAALGGADNVGGLPPGTTPPPSAASIPAAATVTTPAVGPTLASEAASADVQQAAHTPTACQPHPLAGGSMAVLAAETDAQALVHKVWEAAAGPARGQARGLTAETESAPQDMASKDKETARYAAATQRLLDEVEEAVLSFWIILGGGGQEGNKNIDEFLFKQHPQGLTAEDLGAVVREKFHKDLDPAQSTALVHRLRMHAAAEIRANDIGGPDVLSLATLCANIKYLFNRGQLQGFFKAHDANKVLAEYVLASREIDGCDALQALKKLTRDEIHADISDAVGKIADDAAAYLVEMSQVAEMGGTEGSGNSKFVGDDDMSKTFEGKFASADVFHKGLDQYIGLPNPKVMQSFHVCRCFPRLQNILVYRCIRCIREALKYPGIQVGAWGAIFLRVVSELYLLGTCDGIWPLAPRAQLQNDQKNMYLCHCMSLKEHLRTRMYPVYVRVSKIRTLRVSTVTYYDVCLG